MKDIDGIEQILQVLEPHWHDVQADFDRHNQRFLKLAETDHDAIGRVLRAHLVVESFMETFLKSFFGIEDVADLKLTFIQKAKLLPTQRSSAAFVRPGILQLNSVRNKFGHRLSHELQLHEISAIYEALAVARKGIEFPSPIAAIEAFAPVACAFLSVPPPKLQQLFMEAFSGVHSYSHEG
ncbi:MAG: hypothetical protein Q8K12_11385 [Thiobacillus sp.]|nr:hypothetical protein [Thiobacillus sp.]